MYSSTRKTRLVNLWKQEVHIKYTHSNLDYIPIWVPAACATTGLDASQWTNEANKWELHKVLNLYKYEHNMDMHTRNGTLIIRSNRIPFKAQAQLKYKSSNKKLAKTFNASQALVNR